MRWILVFIFLYLIPLVILFRNYRNKKRSLVYSNIYVVLMTLIVICNIYMSGLKRIEESMDKYRAVEVQVNSDGTLDHTNNGSINSYDDKNADKEVYKKYKDDSLESNDFNDELYDDLDDDSEESSKFVVDKNSSSIDDSKSNNTADVSNITNEKDSVTKTNKLKESNNKKLNQEKNADLEKIDNFRKEVFSIEKTALVPMQKCLPYTRNVGSSLSNIKTVKKDVTDARDKCVKLAKHYEDMEIPKLSKTKYENELANAISYMQTTYELRAKSMNYALKLVETKNPKYISKVTDYLDSSDKEVKKFSEKANDLIKEIEDK